jgi:signal transduction histidine kinase
MIGAMTDTTEQKKYAEEIRRQNIELKKLDKLKTTFLNITSHELRTPITPMKGYIQMLLQRRMGVTTKDQKNALEVVLRNINRLDNLIQDILDISRLESKTMKFHLGKTDISGLVEETTATMHPSATKKNIIINAEVERDLSDIVIDRDRIKQVLLNLIDNAIKFSSKGGRIDVRVLKEKENILFEVQDFGRGIPKDKRNKVFDTFFQVDSSIDREVGGVGLGLSIARGIVVAHGGRIWVESGERKGSIFRFTLPIIPPEDIERKLRGSSLFR